MKISVYKTPSSMIEWYPKLLHQVLLELGHESLLVDGTSDVCIDDDITFFIMWNNPIELDKIKGKTKCVALVETEQVHLAYKDVFERDQKSADVVIFPGFSPIGGLYLTKKPLFEMPLGYHPSLCHIQKALPHRNIFMLESLTSFREPYLKALVDGGFSLYSDQTYDLQEIANRAYSVDICLSTHAYGPGSFLPAFRIVGLFIHNQGFVMSERAPNTFLEEDKHIVYFEGVDEMLDKCRYYVNHPEEAKRIALEAFNHIKTLPMTEVVKSTISKICKWRGWE